MKHLIETADLSGLTRVDYDRIVLNSSTNDVIVKRGGYEYVDLGLSVKWAKCNIGAKTEMDYGDYFMWGSTTPNTDTPCNWANAPFNGGAETFNETYFNAHKSEWLDDNGNLKPEDDAATQIMGDEWRMPTKADFQELIGKTNHEWVTDFNESGVNGIKFISKTDINKYIFIPAAGYYDDGPVSGVGSYSNVWSSSLNTSIPNSAWGLYFTSSRCEMTGNYYRCYGRSVRGVRA